MTLHPRLSLNAMVTPEQSFEQDVETWLALGLGCVGLSGQKIQAFGADRAVDLLKMHSLSVSCIVSGIFTLDDESAWQRERAEFNTMIDVAAEVGGSVYGVPGKGIFDDWQGNVARYAKAVAPCLEHGVRKGVVVGFEPTLRPYLSFVHTLRDSLDLSDASGAAVVVDVGNCYSERDVMDWIRKVGDRIAIVQLSDVDVGTLARPGACTRGLPGDGDLPLERFIHAAESAGYRGAYEVEFLGPALVDRAAIAASLEKVSAMLTDILQD